MLSDFQFSHIKKCAQNRIHNHLFDTFTFHSKSNQSVQYLPGCCQYCGDKRIIQEGREINSHKCQDQLFLNSTGIGQIPGVNMETMFY